MKAVGLIGPADRPELMRLEMRLEERGAPCVLLDTREPIALRVSGKSVLAEGRDLTELSGVYVGDLGLSSALIADASGGIDRAASREAGARSRSMLALWDTALGVLGARGVRVVNPPETHDVHALKPWECARYAMDGQPVPETLVTTDAEALASARHPRGLIKKGLVGGYGYTERFEPGTAAESAALVAEGPVLVQECVVGEAVRAFVIDGEVVVAAETVPLDGSEIDSRRGKFRLQRITLPDEVTAASVDIARGWGMSFAAVDWIHAPGAEEPWRVLECNSSPFFVEFERRSGCDLSGRLADHLMGRSFGGV